MTRRSPALSAGALLLAVVLVDQLSKHSVRSALLAGEERHLLLGVKLVRTANHGIAFGISAGGQAALIAIVALVASAVVVFFVRNAARPLVWLPTGLLLGGAAGNLLDRVNMGAVTDFIKLPLWPAFNLADVAITAGVLALLVVLERRGT